jgi:hypothetical protein
MEIILRPQNQVELPKEACRRAESMPGVRLSVEVDDANRKIILFPLMRFQ